MNKLILALLCCISNVSLSREGDICHDQGLDFYYAGIIEIYNGREICNFWRFLNFDAMDDDDRYLLEMYIELILDGHVLEDSEYDFSEDIIIDEVEE